MSSGLNIVAHNLQGMYTNRQLGIANNKKAKSAEKLSTGYKINRAADDAAGLSISEKMRRQIRGLSQGTENVQDGVSLCQTADGALAEVQDMLHRITELSVKSANGTNSAEDRHAIQNEVNDLLQDIDRISSSTKFNEELIFMRGRYLSGTDGFGDVHGKSQIVKEPSGVPVIVGAFKVTGGKLGRDYDCPGGALNVLNIKTDTPLKITNNPESPYFLGYIDIADGVDARLILSNVTIAPIRIADNSTGNVTITLKGDNNLICTEEGAGIQKYGEGGSLTINGTGKLTVQGAVYAVKVPNITIAGGTINAAGTIGGDGADITISGGTVNAQGKNHGNGIGGDGANITISGGTVIAQGGYKAAGIRGEYVTISGGSVIATGGTNGAGIGGDGGDQGKSASHITISGGKKVIATGGYLASGIGGGAGGLAFDINITGGEEVIAKGGGLLAENIGSGHGAHDMYSSTFKSSKNEVHISGGTVRVENGYTIYNASPPENAPENSSTDTVEYKKWWIQAGSENSDDNGMYIEIGQMNTEVLGINNLDVTTVNGARDAIGRMEPALLKLNNIRSKIGAQQNRLEHTIKNQLNVVENTQASESLIRDADMAAEMVKFSKDGILQQAGQSMLSQANQANQGVLSLLQ